MSLTRPSRAVRKQESLLKHRSAIKLISITSAGSRLMTISDGVMDVNNPPDRVKFCVGLDLLFCSTNIATFTVELTTGSLKSSVKVLFSRLMSNDSMRGGVVSWRTILA